MRILALDTALDACSVAVFDTDAGLLAHDSRALGRGHAEALMPMLAQVMARSGLSFAALDRIGVTVGPGSFTGLRVAISAARGIGVAADKPVVGLTTLAAYAAPLLAEDRTRPVAAAIDARHDHVYFQGFAAGGAPLAAPAVIPIVQAAEAAAAMKNCRLAGNAAALLAARWPAEAAPPAAVSTEAAPDIVWVARLAALADAATARPRPLYLRAADAKPQNVAGIARQPHASGG